MKALFLLTFALIVTSCGKDRPGNKEAYEGTSTNCSGMFIDDYNAMSREAKLVATMGDIKNFRQTVVNFKGKYEGVRCEALVNDKQETVDASKEADRILGIIDEKLKN